MGRMRCSDRGFGVSLALLGVLGLGLTACEARVRRFAPNTDLDGSSPALHPSGPTEGGAASGSVKPSPTDLADSSMVDSGSLADNDASGSATTASDGGRTSDGGPPSDASKPEPSTPANSASSAADAAPGTPSGDTGGARDTGVPDSAACPSSAGWKPLIGRAWTLAAGAEGNVCRRTAITNDEWIAGYCLDASEGTQNLTLTTGDTSLVTGDTDCDADTLDDQMLYSGGLGTESFELPTGVGMRLATSSYLNVNLHVSNPSNSALDGTATLYVKTAPQADIAHEADMVFAGTSNLNIPPNQSVTTTGGCTVPEEWHVFGLWPHMRQFATGQAVDVKTESAGTPTVVLDEPFQLGAEHVYPIPELTLRAGGRVRATCTYLNTSSHTVTFGTDTASELCLVGVYKWPAGGTPFSCVE
jgi:Copper type II ascorbate-dependent monooxygenase, C-terminal domain